MGADLTVVQNVPGTLEKKENHREVGALITCVRARIWTEEQRRKHGYPATGVCPRCGECPETLEHRIHESNQNAFIDHPWLVKSQHLCQRACKDIKAETNSAFWLRGLVPREWTAVPCAPEWNEEHARVWAVGKGMQATQKQPVKAETVYLDGSLTTLRCEARPSWWGVAGLDVYAQSPDTARLYAGWLGTLGGEQTAPCAELAALWWDCRKHAGTPLSSPIPRHGRPAKIHRNSQQTPTLV